MKSKLLGLSEALNEASKHRLIMLKAIGEIEHHLSLVVGDGVFTIEDSFNFAPYHKYNEQAYDIYGDDLFGPEVRGLVKAIAEDMTNQDFPVCLSDGEKFCKYFQLNEIEKNLILSKCATNEQYQAYCDYEARFA